MANASKRKPVRRSVSLRPDLAQRVQQLARRANRSTSRLLEELIESGLEAKEAEKQRFLTLAEQLGASTDKREQQRIKQELARMTFGA